MGSAQNLAKERKDDRVIVLEPIPGEFAKNTTGLVDKRLFTGEANLHAMKNPQFDLWQFKYEHGVLPQPLQAQFTTFTKLKDFASEYFKRRGLRIKEIID